MTVGFFNDKKMTTSKINEKEYKILKTLDAKLANELFNWIYK